MDEKLAEYQATIQQLQGKFYKITMDQIVLESRHIIQIKNFVLVRNLLFKSIMDGFYKSTKDPSVINTNFNHANSTMIQC